jgi:hypothetical protein
MASNHFTICIMEGTEDQNPKVLCLIDEEDKWTLTKLAKAFRVDYPNQVIQIECEPITL